MYQIADQKKISPIKQYVKEGENAEFTCSSSQSVIWSFKDRDIPRNAKSINPNKLLISGIVKENQGLYMCEGYDENGFKYLARAKLNIICKLKNSVSNNT